jgi:hypothetical protein
MRRLASPRPSASARTWSGVSASKTAPFFIGDAMARRFVGAGSFRHGPGRPLRLAETRAIGDLVHSHYLAALTDPHGPATTGLPWRR